ncbi:MAG: threonine synthase [Firmicutes bacterium]|jgi:threonine synthase|nr:threonine synthase [Bacillota bacterium]HKM16597.1 threonine synthase [Limnochordia bacterium]
MHYQGIISCFRRFLPVDDGAKIITLHEGNTLLLQAVNLAAMLKLDFELYLKFEGQNPTGSFKDRGMTVAVTKAAARGAKAVVCASTGNTSASAAAYAARAQIKCLVLIPKDAIALGKLAQAVVYGAEVVAVEGNFDQALKLVRELAEHYPITIVNSINPDRIEGQKTAAFEICDQLGDAPDYLVIPVGNAGNITAYWKGFREYYEAGLSKKLPKMCGFQAAGAAPIVLGQPVPNPETIATAIRIGNPASWHKAVQAKAESGGVIDSVTDEDILEAYQLLAQAEGIFAEPASAASVAGMIKLSRSGYFQSGSKVVCILTGTGLKDPDTAISVGVKPKVVAADLKALTGILDLEAEPCMSRS